LSWVIVTSQPPSASRSSVVIVKTAATVRDVDSGFIVREDGVVVTNADLDEHGCLVAAQGAHDGLARAVHPPHLSVDGDAVAVVGEGVDDGVDVVDVVAQAGDCVCKQEHSMYCSNGD